MNKNKEIQREGQLFIFSAPSGGGKSSVIKRLLQELDDIQLSVSVTTRPMREGETEGKDHEFSDEDNFQAFGKERALYEYVDSDFGPKYGTPREPVDKLLRQGKDVILDLDYPGVQQLRKLAGDRVKAIALLPPSLKILRERLEKRGTDAPEVIEKRMKMAAKRYKLIIVMPENMSAERIRLIRHFGAEVILTQAEDGMSGAIHKAEMLKERNPNVIILGQFENEANPNAHRLGTAMEILEDTGGDFDAIVACVGTSGTLTGIASVLKTYNQDLFVAAVEPAGSAVLSGEMAGSHKIQGIGAGFVPKFYDKSLVDEVIKIDDDVAIKMVKTVAETEGLPIGISAGAAVTAAVKLAERDEFVNKRLVVVLPDGVERYLSTGYF